MLCHYHIKLIEDKEYQEVCCEKCFDIYDIRKRWPEDLMFSVFLGLCPECQDRQDKSDANKRPATGTGQ